MITQDQLTIIQNEATPYVDSFTIDGKAYGRGHLNMDWISAAVEEPKVICDVGCYDCGDSIRFKQRFPNCDVYAFEASPLRYDSLRETTQRYNIKLVESAVAEEDGTKEFYDALVDGNRVDAQGSFFVHSTVYRQQNPRIRQNSKPTPVPTITLDTFCKTNNISTIDVLYVDVEGAELLVLKGMKELRPKVIFIETSHNSTDPLWLGDIANVVQIEKHLLNSGYILGKILPDDRLYYHTSVVEGSVK